MGVTNWPRTLGWSDFQELSTRPPGVPANRNASTSVLTDNPSSGIEVDRVRGKFLVKAIEIPLVLVASDTWVITGTKTAALLSHEQGHLDIAGLVAWELYRRIMGTRARTVADLSTQVDAHVAWAGRKMHALGGSATAEGKYDRETNHGINTAEQTRWKDLIRDCMTHDNRALPNP